MDKSDFVDKELARRRSEHQFRNLRIVKPLPKNRVAVNGQEMINFSSNDYLGLSKNPVLQQRSIDFIRQYGVGSTASRLICGTYDCVEFIEKKLANLKGSQSALIFNSGFQANVSIIPALLDDRSLTLSDSLNHNSIIQGISLSRSKKIIYEHNNLDQLQKILESHSDKNFSRILIVTESVFSMDGDRSDIDRLIEIANKYNAMLMVDEAHATGVLGERGMGLTAGKNVDIVMGTFGKALGSFGAYVACSSSMRDYLINCCSGFVYSTALPPSILGAMQAALELVPDMREQRDTLQSNADYLRAELGRNGYDTCASSTQIIPVMIGGEKETMALSKKLEERGFLATAIRPPTVSRGESRIRIALSAVHTREEIDSLINVFKTS